jgi:serine/threonine protein phosphatase PrpC
MSRSLGDDNGKKLGLLTAEPSVIHVDLEQLKKDGNCGSSSLSAINNCEQFLVVSSDGVLDYFSPQEVADFVSFKLYQKQPPVALEQVMAQALDMAARRWNMQMNMGGYRDDMTLVISKL